MSPTSAEVIAGNDDLLAEIIGRTPLKSLIRFKCVSKRWSSLISARHFAILHTLRHPNTKPSGLLLRHKPSLSAAAAETGTTANSDFQLVPLDTASVSGSDTPPLRSFSFISGDPSGTGLKILQSCNGLLLCCGFPFTLESRRLYYVVNPTTNQYAELYSPPEDGASTTFLGVNLAFDPSKSHHYKVVCMQITLRSLYNYRIWIYSSETRRWRISSDSFTSPFDMVFTEGVFWNGSIHWINPKGASLRFDVDQESFGKMPEIPFLRSESRRRRSRYFGASNGRLHLIEIEGQQKTQFQVFEMKGDYSQWAVKYNVNLADAVAAFPEMVRSYLDPRDGCYYSYSIIGVFREENDDESSLVLSIPGKIISYKFKDNTMKELLHCVAGKTDKRCLLQFGCSDIYQYIETLVPVW